MRFNKTPGALLSSPRSGGQAPTASEPKTLRWYSPRSGDWTANSEETTMEFDECLNCGDEFETEDRHGEATNYCDPCLEAFTMCRPAQGFTERGKNRKGDRDRDHTRR